MINPNHYVVFDTIHLCIQFISTSKAEALDWAKNHEALLECKLDVESGSELTKRFNT